MIKVGINYPSAICKEENERFDPGLTKFVINV